MKVKGGLPGVSWGELYEKRIDMSVEDISGGESPHLGWSDL